MKLSSISLETTGGFSTLIGRKLGDFLVKKQLGEGGFGTVFLAEQQPLGRDVVVKVLSQQHRANDSVVHRFLAEARLASRLEHPYAAHIYAFGAEHDGTLWIAMELVRGRTVAQRLKQHGRFTLADFVPLFERICEVVHAAHELGIVHRDLKPQNVMVMERSGQLLPKLLDFGIAKALRTPDGRDAMAGVAELPTADMVSPAASQTSGDSTTLDGFAHAETDPEAGPSTPTSRALKRILDSDSDFPLTVAGSVIGSPQYMAPEQWEGGKVGPWSDIYALGVLAYRMIAGRLPFPRVGSSRVDLQACKLEYSIVSPK